MKPLRKPVAALPPRTANPRQLVIAFEAPQLWAMQAPERRKIVERLAILLMQAAGGVTEEENGDDER
jgi:hypothetical protein